MTLPAFEWTGLAAALVKHEHYRPLQRLGKKAGRQTLLCEERATGRRVVIKLLSFGEDFAWQDLKLFEREAETLRSLDHPAIPKYLDYFDLETPATKGFALVQSYIEARSLQQQLEAGRSFSEAEIQQIGEDLLGILAYLHGRQPPVIHRDIKPSNILLGDRTAHSPGQIYLVDFGSVQTLAAREGGTITVVGTYGYMPPEQFGGRAVPASDLYSLGATLIYLASGRHPADLPQQNLRIQFEEQVQLTPQAIAWLQLLTEPSLELRMASARKAHFSKVRPQAQAPHGGSTGNAKAALKLRPAFSAIEASYASSGELQLTLPPKQIKIITRGENILGICRNTGIGIMIYFALLVVLTPLISFATYWVVALESWLLFLLTVWLFIFFPSLGIVLLARHSPIVTLLINQQAIQVRRPRRKNQNFERTNRWQLSRLPQQDPLISTRERPRLSLFVCTHELLFCGSTAELHWLEQLLQEALGLSLKEEG